MTNEQKKITLTILGHKYTIISDEPEDRILKAALLIDTSLKEIFKNSHNKIDSQKAVILVALKYASEFLAQESVRYNFEKREYELIRFIENEMQANV